MKKSAEMQDKLKEVQNKYKNNPEKLNQVSRVICDYLIGVIYVLMHHRVVTTIFIDKIFSSVIMSGALYATRGGRGVCL